MEKGEKNHQQRLGWWLRTEWLLGITLDMQHHKWLVRLWRWLFNQHIDGPDNRESEREEEGMRDREGERDG